MFYLLQLKLFKNDEKCFLFSIKNNFYLVNFAKGFLFSIVVYNLRILGDFVLKNQARKIYKINKDF